MRRSGVRSSSAPPYIPVETTHYAAGITGGAKGEKLMFAFGAEFVEVHINARTREIRVPRIVSAFAAGHIMNTRTARSQLMGSMIWGVSSALLDETEIDERLARYVNNDIADYLMPVNADVGQVDVILVPEVDTFVNPPVSRASANSATAVPRRRSRTRSITRPTSASASCRSGWKTCCDEAKPAGQSSGRRGSPEKTLSS